MKMKLVSSSFGKSLIGRDMSKFLRDVSVHWRHPLFSDRKVLGVLKFPERDLDNVLEEKKVSVIVRCSLW